MYKKLFQLLIIAFILRLFFLVINLFFFTLPQGGGDDIVFERGAFDYSNSDLKVDFNILLNSGSELYKYLLSIIYSLFGRIPFLLGLSNVILGTLIVKINFKTSLLLWDDLNTSFKIAVILTYFPMLIIESALVLREIPIIYFLSLSLLSFVKFWKHNNLFHFILFIFYLFSATLLHSGVVFLLLGFFVFIMFNKSKSIVLNFILISVVSIMLFIINKEGFGLNKIGGSFDNSYEQLLKQEKYELKGGSKYPEWLVLTNTSKDVFLIPLRFITFFFSPFIPFLVRSFWHLLGIIDSIFYIYFFYLILKNFILLKKNKTAKALLYMLFFMSFVFSLGVTNVGTAIRHRTKSITLVVLLSVGLNEKNKKIKKL